MIIITNIAARHNDYTTKKMNIGLHIATDWEYIG